MAIKIGIISPNLSKLPKTTKDPTFFWFKEIEAAWAYLQKNQLAELHIEQELLSKPIEKKYLEMISKLHQQLAIKVLVPEVEVTENVQCVPKLTEIMKHAKIRSLFQPIVDANKELVIYGLECLSRFTFQGKNLSPEFIFDYAQEKLLIAQIDRHCIELALKQVPSMGLIFINVRPETLISPDFCPWLCAVLQKSHLEIERIVLEITEQHCHILEPLLKKRAEELHSLGIKLAIDDFGTGLSNLAMLETVRPNYLKISGRFSRGIHQDQSKQLIMKNILELAHSFKAAAVIECVESKEEWAELKKQGALLAQGFYFFEPMSLEDLEKLGLKSSVI